MSRIRSTIRLAPLFALVLALGAAAATTAEVQHFATPQQAFDALVRAVRGNDQPALRRILGKGAGSLISSGDDVADASARDKFVGEYDRKHALDTRGETATLSIGDDDWPFPIPLRHRPAGWWFDLAAGQNEILDRRIGRNELDTQQTMLALVDAQTEYASTYHDGLGIHAYAQKFLSTEGRHDGLYWPTAEGEPPSPIGPLVAEAVAAGHHYGRAGADPEPYHGYFYRILKSQGPHAPGGAYDYVVNGVMLGGFGLIAYPAKYGASGVQSFMINQDGGLYQKDLGPKTADIARSSARFDPDPTWHQIEHP